MHLFGAGGTGGYTLEFLTRLLAGTNAIIDVYDGDHVELKNLKRQNFTQDDLDLNKATSLCKRLRQDVQNAPTLIPHEGYIVDEDLLLMDILSSLEEDETTIFILAVDNVATRRLLNKVIHDLGESGVPVIAIDSGNHDQGGQVVLYSNKPVLNKKLFEETTDELELPSMLELYPDINVIKSVHDENPGLVNNCAENAESQPQAMMANVRNADIISNIVQKIVENQTFAHNIWESSLQSQSTTAQFKVKP